MVLKYEWIKGINELILAFAYTHRHTRVRAHTLTHIHELIWLKGDRTTIPTESMAGAKALRLEGRRSREGRAAAPVSQTLSWVLHLHRLI